MSDNNFEKQIQQKLDELKLQPSESVWSRVERRIRKDKRRRTGLFLLPLIIVLLGLGGYFVFYSNDKPTISQTKSSESIPTVTEDQIKKSVEANSTENIDKIEKVVNAPELPAPKTPGKNISAIDEKLYPESFSEKILKTTGKEINANQIKYRLTRNETARKKTGKETKKELAIVEPERNVEPKNNISESVNQRDKSVNDSGTHKPIQLPKDSASTPVKKVAVSDSPAVQKTPAKINRSRPNKLQWGIIVNSGASGLNDGRLFDFTKSEMVDLAYGPPTSGAQAYIPSSIRNGFSFSVGGFINKQFSKRVSVTGGLQYSQFTNRIIVGQHVDSAQLVSQGSFGLQNVRGYYRADSSNNYTNRFHFVELPLSMNLQLNRSTRLPLYFNTGLSLSYLLSTNALHFDGSRGVYYKDNNVFNKLYFNVTTGFFVALFNKTKHPVQLGPQLQYGITNLMKKEISGGKHLVYFGLNSKLLLKK